MAYIGLVYRETQVSDVMGVPPFLVSRCPGDPPSIKNHSPADVKNATEAWRMLICHSASIIHRGFRGQCFDRLPFSLIFWDVSKLGTP